MRISWRSFHGDLKGVPHIKLKKNIRNIVTSYFCALFVNVLILNPYWTVLSLIIVIKLLKKNVLDFKKLAPCIRNWSSKRHKTPVPFFLNCIFLKFTNYGMQWVDRWFDVWMGEWSELSFVGLYLLTWVELTEQVQTPQDFSWFEENSL